MRDENQGAAPKTIQFDYDDAHGFSPVSIAPLRQLFLEAERGDAVRRALRDLLLAVLAADGARATEGVGD